MILIGPKSTKGFEVLCQLSDGSFEPEELAGTESGKNTVQINAEINQCGTNAHDWKAISSMKYLQSEVVLLARKT